MSVFLDTSYFVAYANSRDSSHDKAIDLAEQLKGLNFGQKFTSTYIADEAITYALAKEGHDKAVSMGEDLLNSDITLLDVSRTIFDEAWKLFRQRKGLSFTDCTTVALMRANSVGNLATFDGGFKQFKEINLLG